MQCRSGCGACCTAPSISSAIPGMPNGKAAGETCVQLLDDFRCAIFNDPARPKVCATFMPDEDICGNTREEALSIISILEDDTAFLKSSPSRKTI
nr:YkgJ family cysteine cluster protein [Marinomonas posidonica]